MASSADEDAEFLRGSEQQAALKVVLLGDSAVGKTAICCRFANQAFPQKYTQLWDVGGHNLASLNMLNTYIFGAQAVLFVYDVTSNQSFENLTDWVSIAKKVAKQLEKPFYMALVGNRTDDEHRRVIRVEKHSKFAEQHAMQSHFYVSAKTGDSIELTFKKVAAEILGITYSKAEQEWNINVVQAQIQAADKSRGLKKQQEEKKAVKDENGAKDASNDFSKANNSVTCSMQ